MSRRTIITRVIVFLLLLVGGAIVNVAVAWGCAIVPYAERASVEKLSTEEAEWIVARCIGAAPLDVPGVIKMGGRERQAFRTRTVAVVDPFHVEEHDYGVPFLSLRSIRYADGTGKGVMFHSLPMPSWLMPEGMYPDRLPLLPLWPGFAINTLFYAGILWLLFAAPFALRRRRRIKRGLCPACAYPIGESSVCTECGKPVKRSGQRSAISSQP